MPFGVYNDTTIIYSSDVTSWPTGNIYVIEDTDGMLTITFDAVDLLELQIPGFKWIVRMLLFKKRVFK
ncbi:MAG: hypothetical protein COA88_06535 [Kordia sp.]|nr:MAG: hypothetical protein COA88_06535 [Kordia sp.]